MKRLIIAMALLIGGCGSGGGEAQPAADTGKLVESTQEAGFFLSSVAADGAHYKTVTTKGEFVTLTRIGGISTRGDKRAVVWTISNDKTGEISSQWVRVYTTNTNYDVVSARIINIVSLLP